MDPRPASTPAGIAHWKRQLGMASSEVADTNDFLKGNVATVQAAPFVTVALLSARTK
jgi:hypothetical protein